MLHDTADSSVIAHILYSYGISPAAFLASGMEASVYAYGNDAVLKVYNGTASYTHLLTLKHFYDALNRDATGYALPRMHRVAQHGDVVITVEQRLRGVPMSTLLPGCDAPQLNAFMRVYLHAARELGTIAVQDYTRYKLFDAEALSQRSDGDWHYFLARYLDHRLNQVAPYLARDVTSFHTKMQRLRALLTQPYTGAIRLIHGDFFPGNLLVTETGEVTALLDFGLLTMFGDPLWDIATAWVFFDMYDDLKAGAQERLLALVLDAFGAAVRGKLYRYVLLYSIFSANTYSSTCADGHYRWCVDNLNCQNFWDALA